VVDVVHLPEGSDPASIDSVTLVGAVKQAHYLA
jgi:hypothetical protein